MSSTLDFKASELRIVKEVYLSFQLEIKFQQSTKIDQFCFQIHTQSWKPFSHLLQWPSRLHWWWNTRLSQKCILWVHFDWWFNFLSSYKTCSWPWLESFQEKFFKFLPWRSYLHIYQWFWRQTKYLISKWCFEVLLHEGISYEFLNHVLHIMDIDQHLLNQTRP